MNFIVKKHIVKEVIILAIIDENLLRKTITEGNKILDLKSDFYNGEKKTEQEVLKIIKNANHLNVIGKNIINLLLKENIIEEKSEINGMPYAQVAFI